MNRWRTPLGIARPTGRRCVIVLLVGLAVWACSTPQPLPTYSDAPNESPAGMVLEGTLVTTPDSPCLQIKPTGEAAIGLLWPSGYSATSSPIRIYSRDGTEVAAVGDLVTVGGGAVLEPSARCRTQSTFEVSQIARGGVEFAP